MAACGRAGSVARLRRHPARVGRRRSSGSAREGYLPLALDLPGHGEAADVESPITFDGLRRRTCWRAAPSASRLPATRSAGAIALQVALAAPERVRELVLVSTTAGISDAAERAARRAGRPAAGG